MAVLLGEGEMVKEVKNLTNIKLTESDEDGIWLQFEAGGKACGIALSTILSHGDIVNEAIQAWAREQLDSQPCMIQGEHIILDPLPPAPNNEFLKEGDEERTDKPVTRSKKFIMNVPRKLGIRPLPLVEGGYYIGT